MIRSSLGFFLEDLHRHRDEPVQLIIRCLGEKCLGPYVIVRPAVAIEKPPNEGEERDPLQLTAPLGVTAVLGAPHRRFEALRVAQRLRRERCDDLAEADVAVGKRCGVPLGAEEDRPDHCPPPPDRDDDDRLHVAQVEQRFDVREHRVVRGVRNEHRLPRLERALELGVAIEIDDEVPDRRILVARDQPYVACLAGQKDRAAVEAKGLAQLARDRLQNVYEMERGRDLLENVDERDQLVTLALQLRDPGLQPGDLPSRVCAC